MWHETPPSPPQAYLPQLEAVTHTKAATAPHPITHTSLSHRPAPTASFPAAAPPRPLPRNAALRPPPSAHRSAHGGAGQAQVPPAARRHRALAAGRPAGRQRRRLRRLGRCSSGVGRPGARGCGRGRSRLGSLVDSGGVCELSGLRLGVACFPRLGRARTAVCCRGRPRLPAAPPSRAVPLSLPRPTAPGARCHRRRETCAARRALHDLLRILFRRAVSYTATGAALRRLRAALRSVPGPCLVSAGEQHGPPSDLRRVPGRATHKHRQTCKACLRHLSLSRHPYRSAQPPRPPPPCARARPRTRPNPDGASTCPPAPTHVPGRSSASDTATRSPGLSPEETASTPGAKTAAPRSTASPARRDTTTSRPPAGPNHAPLDR